MPIPILSSNDDLSPFPPIENALAEPNGLLMAGGRLNSKRLIDAYQRGIFPWFEEGEPILWWSPDPRCILWPDKIKIRKSLIKTMRKGHLSMTQNTAFKEVMKACAAPRSESGGTWITDDMLQAYEQLHKQGYAKSIEIWKDTTLVGGLYGIEVGQVFVGESMFSSVSDASKIALTHLCNMDRYKLIDCQLSTEHLVSMGAEEITRSRYIELLNLYA
jgi:leucyl/phenylalanyl-tRNA--protein transferase